MLTARAEMQMCRCYGEMLPSSMRQGSRQPMLMQFEALPGHSQSPAVHRHLPANTAVSDLPHFAARFTTGPTSKHRTVQLPMLGPLDEGVKPSSAALLTRSPPKSSTRPTSCSTITLQGMGHLFVLLLKHETRDNSTSMHHVPPGVRLGAPQCRAPDHTAHDLLSATERPQGKEDPLSACSRSVDILSTQRPASALTMCTQARSTQALT